MPHQPPHRRTWRSLALAGCLWAGAWVVGGLPLAVQAQVLADPRVAWQTADSAHFRIHHRSTQRAQAEQVMRAAERVYPRITAALDWQPRGRIEVVLYSEFDVANGFSTPLPYNKLGVFLAPPDDGALLDNSAWLDLLLVHEFTHAVHLDKVRGGPGVLQSLFGRVPWFMPNLFQPGWATEGIAVFNESDPATGRGRLRGPIFEAWLRAERAAGFLSLREINADGRALPLSKQYLYGAYFYDFLARRYGADKPAALIHRYSGNIVPRLHSNPRQATGKTMDLLWDEFLADLAQQVDTRAAPVFAQPEALGAALAGPLFDMPSVAALPGGELLAVLNDGHGATQLVRFNAEGSPTALAPVNGDARISVAADGRVLLTQYDVCDKVYLAYDVYALLGGRLQQLSACAHLRRAVHAAAHIVALQLDGGRTRLVRLAATDAADAAPLVLYTPPEGSDLIDLVASGDGQRVSLIQRDAGDWRLLEIDLTRPEAAPRLLLRRDAPLSGLRMGVAGLEFIMVEAGLSNVWRLQGATLQRLTHAHTAVVAHGGSAADGSLATVVIAPQGHALHRLAAAVPLQTLALDAAAAPVPAVNAPPAAPAPALGESRAYSAFDTLLPRWWLPAFVADRGLSAYGASISGADALGWHQYTATLMWETSQKEPLGALQYVYADSHGLALTRSFTARAWSGDKGRKETTEYDRSTRLQWLSKLPYTRLQRRVTLGVGAALDRVDRIDLIAGTATRRRDEKVLAALVDLDTRGSNWYAQGVNRGLRATLQLETYKPFASGVAPLYEGTVTRADVRGFVALGRSVLALRLTEVRASGSTEPFQLGGAVDEALQIGYVINNRSLALRGYQGNEAALLGRNARVASAEWRTTLADVDRHLMVPAVGVNRLSATLFADVGGAWDSGRGPATWRRGVGAELLADVKLLYALGLQLRLGLARGLDEPRGTRGYLTLGSAF